MAQDVGETGLPALMVRMACMEEQLSKLNHLLGTLLGDLRYDVDKQKSRVDKLIDELNAPSSSSDVYSIGNEGGTPQGKRETCRSSDISTPDVSRGVAASLVTTPSRMLLQFDGGSRGNPGIAGSGAVLYALDDDDEIHSLTKRQEIWTKSTFVGHSETNNYAEYTGIIEGLKQCASMKPAGALIVQGDSLLVIKQLSGEYKVKSKNLVALYETAKALLQTIPTIHLEHIPRELNSRADELANIAMSTQKTSEWVKLE